MTSDLSNTPGCSEVTEAMVEAAQRYFADTLGHCIHGRNDFAAIWQVMAEAAPVARSESTRRESPTLDEMATPITDAHLAHLNLPDGRKVGIPNETVALLRQLERDYNCISATGVQSATGACDADDARRFRAMLIDPVGARHLLHLLQQGKGGEAAFRSMIDRIEASREAAHTATKSSTDSGTKVRP